jgi:hypothetical protein
LRFHVRWINLAVALPAFEDHLISLFYSYWITRQSHVFEQSIVYVLPCPALPCAAQLGSFHALFSNAHRLTLRMAVSIHSLVYCLCRNSMWKGIGLPVALPSPW